MTLEYLVTEQLIENLCTLQGAYNLKNTLSWRWVYDQLCGGGMSQLFWA